MECGVGKEGEDVCALKDGGNFLDGIYITNPVIEQHNPQTQTTVVEKE